EVKDVGRSDKPPLVRKSTWVKQAPVDLHRVLQEIGANIPREHIQAAAEHYAQGANDEERMRRLLLHLFQNARVPGTGRTLSEVMQDEIPAMHHLTSISLAFPEITLPNLTIKLADFIKKLQTLKAPGKLHHFQQHLERLPSQVREL